MEKIKIKIIFKKANENTTQYPLMVKLCLQRTLILSYVLKAAKQLKDLDEL
jgi:hypothetical protein